MPGPYRVVLDTNVLLAGRTSSHPTSPAAEILDRWQRREFVVLYSLDTLAEYAEKLLSRGVCCSREFRIENGRSCAILSGLPL